jgi:hypothetical protein
MAHNENLGPPATRVMGRSLLCELLTLRTVGQNRREIEMLAEIFLLRLEPTARAAKEAAATSSNPRFVPITLPTAKAS